MSEVYIYGLVDPRSEDVRYIGQTVNPLTRLRHHRSCYQPGPKGDWIADMRACGLKPDMTILEETKYDLAYEREQHWVNHFRQTGKLLNSEQNLVAVHNNKIIALLDDETMKAVVEMSDKTGRSRASIVREAVVLFVRGFQQ